MEEHSVRMQQTDFNSFIVSGIASFGLQLNFNICFYCPAIYSVLYMFLDLI